MQPHRSDIRDMALWTHSPINALKSCEHLRPLPSVWRPGVTSYSELDWNIGEVRVSRTQAGGPRHYHYKGRETQVVSDSQRNTCFRAEVSDRILVTSMKRWHFVRYRERAQRNRFALMFYRGSSGDSWASHRRRWGFQKYFLQQIQFHIEKCPRISIWTARLQQYMLY